MTTEDEKKDICSQVDDKNQKAADNDELLSNLFNVIRSQNSNKTREQNNILIDEDRDEEEEGDDEDDDDEDDEDDHRWDALNKLLDSHLQITKALLHLVKEK